LRRREFGGEIIEVEGGFQYTRNRPGRQTNFTPHPGVSGYAGYYHTHPTFPGYDSERFSDGDKGFADATKQPGYVLTGSGRVLKYDPATQSVTVIRPNSESEP